MAAYHPAGSGIAAAAAAGAAAGAAVVAAATLVAGVAAGAGAEDLYTCACMTCIRSRCVFVPVCFLCLRCTDVCKRLKRMTGPQEGPNRIAEVLGVVHLNGEARLALHCHVWRPRMFGHTYTYTYINIYI
jgi:hypothetical protein